VFPLVVIVAVDFAALTLVFERPWSFPWAANASDPVKINPVTALISMRFVFISLFLVLKIRRWKQVIVSPFFRKNSGVRAGHALTGGASLPTDFR